MSYTIALTVLGACALAVYMSGIRLFDVMYFVYTRTFLGPIFHASQLAKARAKPPHTATKTFHYGGFSVVVFSILSDNYGYMLIDHASGEVAAVDPADPLALHERLLDVKMHADGPLEKVRSRLKLTTILTTHKHLDHSGGNDDLVKVDPSLRLICSHKDKLPRATHLVHNDSVIAVGSGTTVRTIECPGHTPGSVCFYVTGPTSSEDTASRGALFTGDLLFVGGCGKVFEGTASEMMDSLLRLDALPPTTHIFCGHEYSVDNLKFAAWLEPRSELVMRKLATVQALREKSEPTVPTTLAEERGYNPFLRCREEGLRKTVLDKCKPDEHRRAVSTGGGSERVVVFSMLRGLKNRKAHKEVAP